MPNLTIQRIIYRCLAQKGPVVDLNPALDCIGRGINAIGRKIGFSRNIYTTGGIRNKATLFASLNNPRITAAEIEKAKENPLTSNRNRALRAVEILDRNRISLLAGTGEAPGTTQDTVIQRKVEVILPENIGLFFNTDEFDYEIIQIYSLNMIHDSQNQILDLPEGITIHVANIKQIRKSDKYWVLKRVDFMFYDNHLIPLGTHISNQKDKFYVYSVEGTQDKMPINDFMLNHLPQNVTLTRVLSEKETEIFSTNRTDIGSIHELFWPDVSVHTALHNISSEFMNKQGYERAIKFEFSKEELRDLLDSGSIEVANYSFLFRERDPSSPFPFEVEFIFKRSSFEELLKAYGKWRDKTGHQYIDNPFYGRT